VFVREQTYDDGSYPEDGHVIYINGQPVGFPLDRDGAAAVSRWLVGVTDFELMRALMEGNRISMMEDD
jgi:hypothetical protein